MTPPTATATAQLESLSPFDGSVVGAVPTITPDQVQDVVDQVEAVQPTWAARSLESRAAVLRATAQVVLDRMDELTALIAREQGKPRNEATTMEVFPTIDALGWIANEGVKLLGGERISLPLFAKQKRARFAYEPLGVVGVIAPWNYPWTIPFGEVAIALMCGNGVVLKPASLTPLTGEKIAEVFEQGGVPRGLIRTVHGGGAVGGALVKSSVRKIFFTGSVEVGRGVGVACAEQMKGSVLELGGKDPAIVRSDAPLAHTAAGIAWGGFSNGGQTCSGIERVYVARDIADRFTDALVEKAQALTVGDPSSWDTEIGPMTSHEQYELVDELVQDAVAGGATLRCGGPVEPAGLPDADYFAPTVLTGVTHDMRIMREEIFGPVIPVIAVDSDDEAVALANDSDFGLGASVWTADRAEGRRIARRLDDGTVWVNDHLFTHGACACSWGGTKDSGIGRSHSKFGFYECVSIKTELTDIGLTRNPWWHPYDETLGTAMKSTAKLLYGSGDDRREALRTGKRALATLGTRIVRRG